MNLKQFEAWFVTGRQYLYGLETLKAVARHSQEIAKTLNAASAIPVKVVFKPAMVSPDAITELCQSANNSAKRIGLVTWGHTFSPSKMWNDCAYGLKGGWASCFGPTILNQNTKT